jgi:hypothetical protein
MPREYVFALMYRVMPKYERETREMGVKGYIKVIASNELIARYVLDQMHTGYKPALIAYFGY